MARMRISLVRALATAAATLFLALPATAQWRNLPNPVPNGPDGKPNLSAPAPRTPSGKPDLNGIYTPIYRYFQNLAADIGIENVPMTSGAQKIHAARATGLLGYDEPDAHCLPQGVPKVNQAPVPFKIVQTDTLVVLVYEAFNLWRQVHLDGREFADDLNPSWMGYSKGKWEGDTLVVETRGISSDLEIDTGWPHSDQFVLTERIHLDPNDPNVLVNEMRMEDPEALAEPFEVTTRYRRDRYGKLYEFQCSQNDRNPVDEDGNTQFE